MASGCEQNSTQLSDLDRRVLSQIQHDFPIEKSPYEALGNRLGVSAEEVRASVIELRKRGVIRRLGGSFAANQLGYVSVLVAAEVLPEALDDVAACASSFPEVTHNYERSDRLNLWFTVIAESAERLDHILNAVRNVPGAVHVMPLPAQRTFKLKVDFNVT